MSIVTRWNSPAPFRAAVWDGSPGTLADVAVLVRQELVERDGVVAVVLADGSTQDMRPGWWGYTVLSGAYGVVSPEVAADWLAEDPRAA